MRDFHEIWDDILRISEKLYDIDVGNNTRFVAETIYSKSSNKTSFVYAECGVYRGTTFLPIYHFLSELFDYFHAYAIDSFEGFPPGIVHPNDHFDRFETMYNQGKISKRHFLYAKNRKKELDENEHLWTNYFQNYKRLFLHRCMDKPEVSILKTPFDRLSDKVSHLPKGFDLVFLDCDLYLSYKQCLDYFKDKTELFILDEYFSLKYPGARIACDEFVQENPGWEFFGKTEANPYFERWGIVKRSS